MRRVVPLLLLALVMAGCAGELRTAATYVASARVDDGAARVVLHLPFPEGARERPAPALNGLAQGWQATVVETEAGPMLRLEASPDAARPATVTARWDLSSTAPPARLARTPGDETQVPIACEGCEGGKAVVSVLLQTERRRGGSDGEGASTYQEVLSVDLTRDGWTNRTLSVSGHGWDEASE